MHKSERLLLVFPILPDAKQEHWPSALVCLLGDSRTSDLPFSYLIQPTSVQLHSHSLSLLPCTATLLPAWSIYLPLSLYIYEVMKVMGSQLDDGWPESETCHCPALSKRYIEREKERVDVKE